jgi:hypothetical protein
MSPILPWALQKEILQARVYKLEAQLIARDRHCGDEKTVTAAAADDPAATADDKWLWPRAADPWFRAAQLLLRGRTAAAADPWLRAASFLTAVNKDAAGCESGKFGDPAVVAAAADDPAAAADEKTVTAAAADEKLAAADDPAAAADDQSSHSSDWDDDDRAAYAANAPIALAQLDAAADPWAIYMKGKVAGGYESVKFGNPAVTAAAADDPAAAVDEKTVIAAIAADEKTLIAAAANACADAGNDPIAYDRYVRATPSQVLGSAASILQRELLIRDHELFCARKALDLVRQVDASDLHMAAALVLLDPCMHLGAQERGAIDWGHQIIRQRQARDRALQEADEAYEAEREAEEAAADDRQARDRALQEADEAAADEREAEEAAADDQAGRPAVEMWL